jgi:hypothetical protein
MIMTKTTKNLFPGETGLTDLGVSRETVGAIRRGRKSPRFTPPGAKFCALTA